PRMSTEATDDERIAALRLIRTESVGPITYRELIDHFGSAARALDALPDLSRRAGRRLHIVPAAAAKREIEALAEAGGRLVILGEPGYPPWLASTDGAPPVLSIRGDPAILARPMIAVVGSRNASVSGRR